MSIDKQKAEFCEIFNANIKRSGAAELLAWMLKSDFFTAPASTKYHGATEGGLCAHSLFTYNRLRKNIIDEFGEQYEDFVTDESIAICALLHDLCKIDFYKVESRNQRVDGEWVSVPYYTVCEQLPYGHGEKSVYIISGFMRLSREEAMAINWHMGGFDARAKGGSFSVGEAYDKFFLAVMTHIADMEATYLSENSKLNAQKESINK